MRNRLPRVYKVLGGVSALLMLNRSLIQGSFFTLWTLHLVQITLVHQAKHLEADFLPAVTVKYTGGYYHAREAWSCAGNPLR